LQGTLPLRLISCCCSATIFTSTGTLLNLVRRRGKPNPAPRPAIGIDVVILGFDEGYLATIPGILPGAARFDDKSSAARRIYASVYSSTGSFSSASGNRVHCFHGSGQQLHRLEAPCRAEADRFASAGPVSLSRINGRLGQRALAHLPFPRHP
jgi:hypothetical protein